MSKITFEQGRRRALRFALGGMTAIPFGGLLLCIPAQAQEKEKVSPDDPQAKTLNYVEDATQAERPEKSGVPGEEQFCKNCQFYQGSGDWAPCSIFQGKLVAADAWCSSWAPKA